MTKVVMSASVFVVARVVMVVLPRVPVSEELFASFTRFYSLPTDIPLSSAALATRQGHCRPGSTTNALHVAAHYPISKTLYVARRVDVPPTRACSWLKTSGAFYTPCTFHFTFSFLAFALTRSLT